MRAAVASAAGIEVPKLAEVKRVSGVNLVFGIGTIIGGAVPVPGGLGVWKRLIAGLTSAGIPQHQAVAAVFIQRLFTAYLPPIWGWATLAWMRRREYE